VPFEKLSCPAIVASGERAADLGVRLSYAGLDHSTESDPVAALALLPLGTVDVVLSLDVLPIVFLCALCDPVVVRRSRAALRL